jgi:ectoine hydroxylase-related dioxygenase (phytanoyl-CoA dioxygenase family)
MAELESDYMRWGYCLVKDAFSPSQLKAARERLLDQAAAEVAAELAILPDEVVSGQVRFEDRTQDIANLPAKSQIWRDIVAFEPHACQAGPTIEAIMKKILGPDLLLSSSTAALTGPGGGLQELHQDQGFMPVPHPPYPVASNIMYLYSDWDKESGGTYLLPGSHLTADNTNVIDVGSTTSDVQRLLQGEDGPKLVSLCAPAGTCVITDGRLVHSGALRTREGQRLVQRVYYCRAFIRQQEPPLLSIPDAIIAASSDKFRALCGLNVHATLGNIEGTGLVPGVNGYKCKPTLIIGELSLTRPEEFEQEFDYRRYRADVLGKLKSQGLSPAGGIITAGSKL